MLLFTKFAMAYFVLLIETRSAPHLKALFTGLIVGVCSEDFQVGDEVDDSGEFFEASVVAV